MLVSFVGMFSLVSGIVSLRWGVHFVIAQIPLADSLFGLKPLQQPTDYLVVRLAVLAWAIVAILIWQITALWTRWRGVDGV